MLIRRARLKNFMSIDDLFIDFTENIYTVISGDNASGKSSLLEAFGTAINERRKGDSYRDYVQTGKKKALIDLDITLEGKDMRLVLEINNSKYGAPVKRTLYIGDDIYENSDCSKLLKTFNVKYLQHITFFHQKDSSVLNLKPSEVSSLLKELFEIDYTTQASVITQEVTTLEESGISLNSKLSTLDTFFFSLKEEDLKEDPTAELERINRTITQSEVNLKEFEKISKKAEELSELTIKLENAERAVEENIIIRDSLIEEDKKRIARQVILSEEIRTAKLQSEVKVNSSDVDDMESQLQNLSITFQETRDLLPEKKAKIAKLERELDAYTHGTCPVCNHELSDQGKIVELQTDIALNSKMLTDLEEQIKTEKSDMMYLTTTLNKMREAYNTQKNDVIHAGLIFNQLTQEKKSILEQITAMSGHSQNIEDQLAQALVARDSYRNSLLLIGEIGNEINTVNRIKKELETLSQKKISLERIKVINELREISNKKVIGQKETILKQVNTIKKEINLAEKKIQSNKEALNILLNEFPNYVILQKTSQLESSINTIIQKIFPEMTVKLTLKRSGISFYYSPKSNEAYLPAKMASGAQSAVLMLAWRVALAEMYGIDTLILDEIDADATDENSAVIYDFVGTLTSFEQIIIISHRKSSIKTIRDGNESVRCFWVVNGEYLEDSPELNV